MTKICVYAICKNENSNIIRWYSEVQKADLVFLLDTGSTDNTMEIAAELPGLICQQYIQEGNFDFSVARNEALRRARTYCDNESEWVFVSLDLDEFLEEGGIEKIRNAWHSDYDTLRLVGVTANAGKQFVDHKVHSSANWVWKRSVHEIISLPGKKQKEWHVGTADLITYLHEQDVTKDRDYYSKLLLEYENNPTDIKTVIYLAWESYNAGKYDDYLEYNLKCIDLIKTNTEDEFYMDYEYLLQCYFNCANYHTMHRQFAVANMYLTYAAKIIDDGNFPPIRKLYFQKAKVLWELEQKEIAINYYKKCLEIKERPFCWVDDDECYNDAYIHSMISNGYFYYSKPKEALAYAEIALSLEPYNERLQENVECIRNYLLDYVIPEKKNKICVYAICKNEEQFVETWLNSMQEADYIVVLDTGSTDSTFEKLKNDPRVYRAEQKVITPWRFDTARNEGMKLIPDDANILLSTDLDEILEPGWADVIRKKWIDGYHIRGTYKYAWSHTEDGKPGRIFYYDKLHDKNWYWTAPVHELLKSEIYTDEDLRSRTLDLFNEGVYLHHYPDWTKSRGTYLPLLELRAKEDPEDYYGKFYLSHEYHYRGMYEKSNEVLHDIIDNYRDKYSQIEIAACYLFLGDNHRALGDSDMALYYYNLAIVQDNTYREPYLLAAEVCNEKQQYNIAIGYIRETLNKTYRHYTWIERDESWSWQPDDIAAIAYFYSGDKVKALAHAEAALAMNPYDERLKSNIDIIRQNMN